MKPFPKMTYSEFRNSQKFFSSNNGNIAYRDIGNSKNVILLLHGVPTSGWLYRYIIPILAENDYRVIVPDMLGFGNSDNPNSYELYHETAHAKRIIALMNFLGIENWTHTCHDAGGLWTWELLKIAPKRVSRLVILNTIIYKEGFHPPVRFGKNGITKTIISLYKTKLFNGTLVKQLFKQGTVKKMTKEDINGYKTPLLEGKINGMYHFFSKTKQIPDYKDLLQKLNIQVKVIWGINDPFLKWEPQASDVIKDLNINKEDIHLLKAKHFIQESSFKEISQLIINIKK